MRRSTLKILRCPRCEASLEVEEVYREQEQGLDEAVLRCRCGRYPVVDRILVYRPEGFSRQEIAEFGLQDPRRAVRRLLVRELFRRACPAKLPGPLQRARWRLGRRRWMACVDRYLQTDRGALFDLIGDWGDPEWEIYLKYRPASPTYLILLHLFQRLVPTTGPPRCILDLCCGLGHFSALLGSLLPATRILCADISFLNLYINLKYMAHGADAILLDANHPLPFVEDAFSLGIHIDSFHYIQNKELLSREIVRVVRPDGRILMAHLHNGRMCHIAPGEPLEARAYSALFEGHAVQVYDEEELFRTLAAGGELTLDGSIVGSDIDRVRELWMIIGSGESGWCGVEPEEKHVPRGSCLSLNPLYRFESNSGAFRLFREFPSSLYRKEYGLLEECLPEKAVITMEEWNRLSAAVAAGGAGGRIGSYLANGLLVVTPDFYFSPSWPSIPIQLLKGSHPTASGEEGAEEES